MSEEEENNLQSSKLGTKEYWDETYKTEIRNYISHGDIGEVWFGEDSEFRIIRWLKSSNLVTESDAIIDLGCGNGMMLIELAREGFKYLTGVDYSQTAIDLATSIAITQGFEFINYKVCDIREGDSSLQGFSVALDKGTYDAVSLTPEAAKNKLLYKNNIVQILKPNGLLVITSCNWSEQELIKDFENDFDVVTVIPTPTFQFGGKIGNLVSSIVFKKKAL